MKEVKLPSGAGMKITPAPFVDAKALYQACLEELKEIPVNTDRQVHSLLKDVICSALSSRKVEACLWKCMERVVYNSGNGDLKITMDTFEPLAAREDYVEACIAVAEVNLAPFLKSLYAAFSRLQESLQSVLK